MAEWSSLKLLEKNLKVLCVLPPVLHEPCFASLVFLPEVVSWHVSGLNFTHQELDEMLRAREGGETPQVKGSEILHLSLRAASCWVVSHLGKPNTRV